MEEQCCESVILALFMSVTACFFPAGIVGVTRQLHSRQQDKH